MKEAERNMIHKNLKEQTVYQFELDHFVHPADIFAAFNAAQGTRYFFENKSKDEWLIGIGHHQTIMLDRIDSIAVNTQFSNIIKSYRFNGLDRLYTRLFGGFQFDEGTNSEYDAFGHSHFIWPEIQFLYIDGRIIVSSCSSIDKNELMDRLEASTEIQAVPTILEEESIEEERFLSNVASAVSQMKAHAFEKVVLSRSKRLKLSEVITSELLIARAMQTDENSYFLLMEQDDKVFVSKTPEQLLKVKDNQFFTNAIAGTMSRSEIDADLKLLKDPKNLHEHDIVVNSIMQDIKQVVSHISLPDGPAILENRYFYHLYTPISGELTESNVLDMSVALHPTPALGGYPKAEASEFILKNEGNRGFYGAPIGYVDADYNGEFVVAIRSMLVEGDTATIYAGCGVVADSTPEEELLETEIKFKPMLQLLGGSF